MPRKKSMQVAASQQGTTSAIHRDSAFFSTGENVPESGIYKVLHGGHRLAHEVTLLRGQQFPRCSKCADAVKFEAVRLVPKLEDRFGIVLNEVPEVDPAA